MPVWLVVLSAASVVGIAMGLRQVMGLYLKPVSMELGVGRQEFGLAIAIANIVWGVAAPFMGAISDTYGAARIVIVGGLATAGGLLLTMTAATPMQLYGAGVLLGLGVAGAGINALVGAVSRVVTPERRSAAVASLGIGSGFGILIALPYTHLLIEAVGWKASLAWLAATALAIMPLALAIRDRPTDVSAARTQTMREALAEAFRYPSFWLLNAGFFVCGFHVVFYGTHLPAYVADLGMSETVAATALTVVGIGNLVGTWLAGQWGRTRPKRWGLCLIYAGRAVVFLGFLFLPVTPLTVVALSAILGLLWLSTVPLTSTLVATFFGPGWMTMLYGIVFFSHQVGSFLGVWLGGVVFDRLKSYDAMWWISVGLGIAAALVHIPIRERSVARLQAHPVKV
jgi:predicted MFS family arabinose efflux permease